MSHCRPQAGQFPMNGRLRPAMTASYSVSLLVGWNPNLSAYSISIPSGEFRIRPAPLPCAFVARLQKVSKLVGQSVLEYSRQAPLR